jgi:hypothetical protein
MSEKQKFHVIWAAMRRALIDGLSSANEMRELYDEECHRGGSAKKNTSSLDPFRFDDDKMTQTYEDLYLGHTQAAR